MDGQRRPGGAGVGVGGAVNALVVYTVDTAPLVTRRAYTRDCRPYACRRVRRLAIGRRIAAIVATDRPVHFISVSASGVTKSRPVGGAIHLGPGRNVRRSNRILTVIAVIARQCHARCTLLCAAELRRTIASGRVRRVRGGTCGGPTIALSSASVTHCTHRV